MNTQEHREAWMWGVLFGLAALGVADAFLRGLWVWVVIDCFFAVLSLIPARKYWKTRRQINLVGKGADRP